MTDLPQRRFVTANDVVAESTAFTLNTWLSRPDMVPCDQLLLVRATLDPERCHPFHHHPHREEIIYILSGRAEQWCGTERRLLTAGEMVLIPKGEVHGTYNPHPEPVIFLAMLSPADAPDPGTVDVSQEAPWATLRQGLPACK